MDTARPIRFGVSRSHGGGLALLGGAHRFAEALAARVRRPGKLFVTEDYQHLLDAVLAGTVEAAWVPPAALALGQACGAHVAAVSERHGYLNYRSAVLVAAASPAVLPADLYQVRAAWTDPESASGYLVPRMHLLRTARHPQQLFASERFHGSPSEACAAVADGAADLCACHVTEQAATDPTSAIAEVQQVFTAAPWRLRVLVVTDPIPPDGILLGAALDPSERASLTGALLGLHQDPAGRAALDELLHAERLVPLDGAVAHVLAELRRHLLPG